MQQITNHLPTAELQALDAAHHMHPFSTQADLAESGVRVITSAKGVMLKDSEGEEILDAMAGLWCVNVGYGREELVEAAARQLPDIANAVEDRRAAGLSFEEIAKAYKGEARKVANYVIGSLLPFLNERDGGMDTCSMKPDECAEVLGLIDDGTISLKIAKDILPELVEAGGSPRELVEKKGLVQVSDTGELEAWVDQVIADNPAEVEAFKGGKKKLMGFFMGQVMRISKGQANPGVVTQLFNEKLQ